MQEHQASAIVVPRCGPCDPIHPGPVVQAMKGAGTNEQMLIDVLAHCTAPEVAAIKEAYLRMYGKTLEHDLAGASPVGGRPGRSGGHIGQCGLLPHVLWGSNTQPHCRAHLFICALHLKGHACERVG